MIAELTVSEYAGIVGVCDRTIHRWITDGMPHSKIGGRIRINAGDVARWWEARKNRTNHEASRAITEKYRKFPGGSQNRAPISRRAA